MQNIHRTNDAFSVHSTYAIFYLSIVFFAYRSAISRKPCIIKQTKNDNACKGQIKKTGYDICNCFCIKIKVNYEGFFTCTYHIPSGD